MTEPDNQPQQQQPLVDINISDTGLPLLPLAERWKASDRMNQEIHSADYGMTENPDPAAVQEYITQWEISVKMHAFPGQFFDLPDHLQATAIAMYARLLRRGIQFLHCTDTIAWRCAWIIRLRFPTEFTLYADRTDAVLIRNPSPVVENPTRSNGIHIRMGIN